jgi:RNA polymerase sigma-70 factor (ECF subfamily)
MEQTDRQLILKIQNGDEDAYETIYRRYNNVVWRQLRGVVRNDEVANDLVQEVFLRVWTHAQQWDGRGSFQGWLLKLSTNLALNHLRTVRRHPQLSLEPPDELFEGEEGQENRFSARYLEEGSLGPAETLEKIETYRELRRMIDELPEEKREVFSLIHDAQLETREVAQKLGIPEGTVKSRLYYSNKLLARRLENPGEVESD